MFCNSILGAVGETPLVRLKGAEKRLGARAKIFAKAEFMNPTGSVKDRAVKAMIDDAIDTGRLKEGGTIVEATSGNTGISLAAFGAAMGFRVIVVMPETMSEERRRLIRFYGAEIVLTRGELGAAGAVEEAERIIEKTDGAVGLGQFRNPANPLAHYRGTGREIYRDLDGNIDIFVAGVGTGGTLCGCGKFLKEKIPSVKVVAVEPLFSPMISLGRAGKHKIQGIGAGFIPENYRGEFVDEVIAVSDSDAIKTAALVAKTDGTAGGISSGAALWAAAELAKRSENEGKNIVVVLPDSADRYFSTELF